MRCNLPLSRRRLLAASLLGGLAPARATEIVTAAVPGIAGQVELDPDDTPSVPMFRGNPARTGEHPGPGPSEVPALRWEVQLGNFLHSSPAVVGGTVYIGSVTPIALAGGALHAVDAATGEERWRLPTNAGDAIFSSPAIVDGSAYVGSYDGVIVAADAGTGEERWRFQAEAGVFSSPNVVDGVLYVGDDGGHLYAIDAADGEERWRFAAGEGFERAIGSAPAVVDGIVYAVGFARRVGETSFLHAFDAATGEERWRFAAEEGGNLRGTPAVADGRVHVATLDGFLYTAGAEDGEERWRFDGGGAGQTSPAVAGGIAYFGADGKLFAVDTESGQAVWSRRLVRDVELTTAPTVADGTIYVGDASGVLHSLDATSGDEVWRFGVLSYMSSPAIVGGTIYVGGDDGALRALGGRGKHDPSLR